VAPGGELIAKGAPEIAEVAEAAPEVGTSEPGGAGGAAPHEQAHAIEAEELGEPVMAPATEA
jgi:hypothetical protein